MNYKVLATVIAFALGFEVMEAATVATPYMWVTSPDAPPTSRANFTNAVALAAAGDWIIVPPGPPMHVPTNQLSLLRPGVNFEVYSDFVIGCPNDAVARPTFSETVATTNRLIFHKSLIVSNQSSQLVAFSNAASRIYFEASRAWRAGTSVNYAALHLGGGTFFWNVSELQNDGYDGYWASSGAITNFGKAGRILAADSAIEMSAAVTGISRIETGLAKHTHHAHYKPVSTAFITDAGGNSTLVIDEVDCGTNGLVTLGGTGVGVYRIGRITASSLALTDPVVTLLEGGRLIGTHIDGPNLDTPVIDTTSTGEMTLENCTLNPGASATEVIRNLGLDVSVRIVGGLHITKPSATISIFNAMYGGQVSSAGPFTNNYAGTNVFVNIGGHTHQALVATNAMLLILTNSTALLSGKEITLTIYNNKATNMNVAYSAAGFRPMNQVQNTVTNGRSLRLEITRIGTNNNIRAFQQQN